MIDAMVDMGVDAVALSFVRRREDIDPVREHLQARGADIAADRQDREAAGAPPTARRSSMPPTAS